jgi:hypothetical protein
MNREANSASIGWLNCAAAAALAAGLTLGTTSVADDKPVPSKHQLMKDCMAKQKASEAGRSKQDMKKACEDVAKTEKQNADRAEKTNSQ